MDLISISGEDASQFKFIVSDEERRSIWFPCIISALKELKADIERCKSHVNVERYSSVKSIREITYYLIRKRGNLMKEIETYLHWFTCRLENVASDFTNADAYSTSIFVRLNEIEDKGVAQYIKEFYNMFEISPNKTICRFGLKEDVHTILFQQAGAISLGVDDLKLKVETTLPPRDFFSKLPIDFPHWFVDGKFEQRPYTNFRDD